LDFGADADFDPDPDTDTDTDTDFDFDFFGRMTLKTCMQRLRHFGET